MYTNSVTFKRIFATESTLPEGSVVFMENSVFKPIDGIIERKSNSPLSHTAIMLRFDGKPYVYEGYPPRYRKMPLTDYFKLLEKWRGQRGVQRRGGLNSFWWEPRQGLLTPEMLKAMRAKGEALLGAKYSLILNWWFDKGVHCSEGVGLILEAAGLITCDGGRETPGSVLEKVLTLNEYNRDCGYDLS